jgi:cytochrome P450
MLPPGPRIPKLVSTMMWMRDPFGLMDRCAKRFGEPYTMNLAGFAPIVVAYTPETVKEIFADDGETFEAGRFNKALAPLLGDKSVLMLDGAEHRRHRRLLLPPFHGERMKAYGEVMLAAADAKIDEWSEGNSFALHPHMQEITLRVIVRTVFGFEEGPRFDEMMRRLKRILDLAAWPPLLIPAMQVDLGPYSPWGKFRRAVAFGDEYLYEAIAERRATGVRGADVLSLLLDARDEEGELMSDAELRDELTTLLIAGHETSATALAWAVRWTLGTPGLADRLRTDIAEANRADGTKMLTAARAAERESRDTTCRRGRRWCARSISRSAGPRLIPTRLASIRRASWARRSARRSSSPSVVACVAASGCRSRSTRCASCSRGSSNACSSPWHRSAPFARSAAPSR